MEKKDAKISLIIGLLIGIFFFIILKNIGIEIPHLWLLIIVFPPLSLLGMLIVSLLGKKFLIILQAGRFVLVGAFNTFIDLGVLNILIWLSGTASGAWYSIFKAISFLVATTNSYFWNKHWTFNKKSENGFAAKEFSKFLAVTAIGLLVNVGIASFIVNIIGPQFEISKEIWATIGALIATLFAWVWNFLSSKFIVFKV
jgi:putative flippase GtrA